MPCDKGDLLIESYASMNQQLLIEEQCILSTLKYSMCVAPYSRCQIDSLEAARAQVIKAAVGLNPKTIQSMLFLPRMMNGVGSQPLMPLYQQVLAESLSTCHNDTGRLGRLARCVTAAHLHAAAPARLANPPYAWETRQDAMVLRKAAFMHEGRLHIDIKEHPGSINPDLDTYE